MRRVAATAICAALATVAFCTPTGSKPLDDITNQSTIGYTLNEMERGAPSFPVTARLLYREAIELLSRGDRDGAVLRLRTAASLSGDFPDPLFTLARIELFSGNPDFLPHLAAGIERSVKSWSNQGILAANAAALLVATLLGGLAVLLLALLVRYAPLIDHAISERIGRRIPWAPARWIGPVILVAALALRAGAAIFIAILVAVLWAFMKREERAVILTLVILVAMGSFGARYSNAAAPALDPRSATRTLSLINSMGADEKLIDAIRGLDDSYEAERDFALGTLMFRLGDYEAARRSLLASVAARPDNARAYINLGNVYFAEGDYDRALAGYQNALELDSLSAVAHYNVGQAYIKKFLFAQSSAALQRANELGIELFRAAHPAIGLRNAPIYEEGFGARELWSLSLREGSSRDRVLLSEVFQPILLVPFQWLWTLLAGAVAAGVILERRLSRRWGTATCDNCGTATCERCADAATGINLCRECANVISGLTSVKVMEALLRHRRQKTAARSARRARWRIALLPGAAFVLYGRIMSGAPIALASAAAAAFALWRGQCFADPSSLTVQDAPWRIVAPLALLALCCLTTLLARPPEEPKNYRILPAQMRELEKQRGEERRAGGGASDAPRTDAETAEPVEMF